MKAPKNGALAIVSGALFVLFVGMPLGVLALRYSFRFIDWLLKVMP